MGWHYIAVRHDNDGEIEYGLHESFPGTGRTVDAVTVWGETPAALAKMLRAAADDVEKFPAIEEC